MEQRVSKIRKKSDEINSPRPKSRHGKLIRAAVRSLSPRQSGFETRATSLSIYIFSIPPYPTHSTARLTSTLIHVIPLRFSLFPLLLPWKTRVRIRLSNSISREYLSQQQTSRVQCSSFLGERTPSLPKDDSKEEGKAR